MLNGKQMKLILLSQIALWACCCPVCTHCAVLTKVCLRSVSAFAYQESCSWCQCAWCKGVQVFEWLHLCAASCVVVANLRCATSQGVACLWWKFWWWYFFWPVLKHGPRSLMHVRVDELTFLGTMKMTGGMCAPTTNQSIVRGLSLSMCVRTRKMVNYAWGKQSQGKLWWRLVAILTCKSFVILEYRGERLIEPSSSWFPLKFPSG